MTFGALAAKSLSKMWNLLWAGTWGEIRPGSQSLGGLYVGGSFYTVPRDGPTNLMKCDGRLKFYTFCVPTLLGYFFRGPRGEGGHRGKNSGKALQP